MAKETTTTSDRKTHAWTEDQLRYVAERPSVPRVELIEGFRREFPDFTGSDTSITGRRYRILRDGSSKHPELGGTALAARVEQLKQELADAEAALAAYEAKTQDSKPTVEEITALPMDEIRSLADKFGVSKGGSKKAIAERIATA